VAPDCGGHEAITIVHPARRCGHRVRRRTWGCGGPHEGRMAFSHRDHHYCRQPAAPIGCRL